MTSSDARTDRPGPRSSDGSELEVAESSGPGSESIICTVRVESDAASVARVRHQIVADLQERQLSEKIVDEAEIVASELLTNAVRHARPLSDGTIRVEGAAPRAAHGVALLGSWPAHRAVHRARVGRHGGPHRQRRLGHPRRAEPPPRHLNPGPHPRH